MFPVTSKIWVETDAVVYDGRNLHGSVLLAGRNSNNKTKGNQ
jgi:hypothetical protein